MNNALPIAFLRPSCAAFRPSLPSPPQWSAARCVVKRSFCSSISRPKQFNPPSRQREFNSSHRSPLSALIHPNGSGTTKQQLCAFSTSQTQNASISDTKSSASSKTRKIKVPQLPDGPVDETTISQILGPTISEREGNGILRILHQRRVSGSLGELGMNHLNKKFPQLTDELSMQGLEWLRQKYPIDEEAAAGEWAEQEAERLEEEVRRERYRKMGLWKDGDENEGEYTGEYKPGEGVGKLYEEEYKPIETSEWGGRPTSESVFERMRMEKRAKRMEEAALRDAKKLERLKEEEEKIAKGEAVRGPLGLMKPDQTVTTFMGINVIDDSQSAVAKQWREKAMTIKFKTKEELEASLTTFQRLYPTTLFTLGAIVCSILAANYYTEPTDSSRLFPWLSIPLATCLGLFFSNYAIFIMWHIRSLWPLLNKYFLAVPAYPRAVAALGNVFSHQFSKHLWANMIWLMTIGWWCAEMVGRGPFLSTYFTAGILGSTLSLFASVLRLPASSLMSSSLGASGAMYGITSLALLTTSADHIWVPFLDINLPFNPKLFLVGIVAIEVFVMRGKGEVVKRMVESGSGGVDHWSHLGGMVAGMGMALALRFGGFGKEGGSLEGAEEREEDGKDVGEMNAIEGAGVEEVRRAEEEVDARARLLRVKDEVEKEKKGR